MNSSCDLPLSLNPAYQSERSARYYQDTETTQVYINDVQYSCRFTYFYYDDGSTRVITHFKEVMLIWFPGEHPSKEFLIDEIKENLRYDLHQSYRFEL